MSIDLTAILRQQLAPGDVFNLPNILNCDVNLADSMRELSIALYGLEQGKINSLQWAWNKYTIPRNSSEIKLAWAKGEPVDISGPICSLYISRHQLQVATFFRVTQIATNPLLQFQIKTVLKNLHKILNEDRKDMRILFVPDSAHPESRITYEYSQTFSNLVDWSIAEFGSPLETVSSMARLRADGYYDSKGYVLTDISIDK